MKMKKKGASEPSPWETGKPKKIITGVNLRFGFHQNYVWIQVHGKRKAHHEPLALNPLGNTVAIGSVKPDRRMSMYANGNGYVLGTLYVKMGATKGKTAMEQQAAMEASRVRDYSELGSEDALAALRESQVRRQMLAKTAEAQDELLSSRLTLINMPKQLKDPNVGEHASVNRLTDMFNKVLKKQETHMASQ